MSLTCNVPGGFWQRIVADKIERLQGAEPQGRQHGEGQPGLVVCRGRFSFVTSRPHL